MGELDDIIRDFLIESSEGLDQLDQHLIALEQDPTNLDLVASIFRCIHTIKGTCGFFGFSNLESVTHAGENLLSRLRDGELLLSADITGALLAMVDAVRTMLVAIEQTGSDGGEQYADLIGSLEQLVDGGTPASDVGVASTRRTSSRKRKRTVKRSRTDAAASDRRASGHTEAVAESSTAEVPAKGLADDASRTSAAAAAGAQNTARAVVESSIRVDVGLLDKLMNLVGELVLARNQVLQYTDKSDTVLGKAAQQLNLITSELQEGVMKTRMQPMATVLNKFPRVVRDLARGFGKKVRLDMDGAETELDKSIIEAVKDPLTHVIRNAVDHGIESPEVRAAAGKLEEGRISLRAYHEGGQVTIEVSDDGAGLDPARIKATAVEKGVLTGDQAAALSDREVVNMIFRAGFSTARKVTNVSGRGVGMDVVRANIERIGGSVEVQSARGSGTTLKLKIPLTLAIIPALIVHNGSDRYAIPQAALLELVRLTGDEVDRGIEYIHGVPVYRLRERLLPLVYLSRELENAGPEPSAATERSTKGVNIAVLQADGQPFGLVVDGVSDTTEIVVKPLSRILRDIPVFAAATILGDGRVALILDVMGLAQRTGVVGELRHDVLRQQEPDAVEAERGLQTLLLFSTPDNGRMAIPLSAVTRLEEFQRSAIEHAGDQDVIQYRGVILPLIYVSDALPERRAAPRSSNAALPDSSDRIHVVVHSVPDGSVGLVVDRIIDITKSAVELERAGSRRCVLGSAVIDGRVTEFLDVDAVVRHAEPMLAGQTA